MTAKVGPYGSHYGQGCYTKNCSLRHASDAGVTRPVSYEETDKVYRDAQARYMTAKGSTGVREARLILDKARARRSATPEGLKELKADLLKTRALFGNTAPATFIKEDELQNALNLHDKQEAEFKLEVFRAAPSIGGKDIKNIVEHASRYNFDKTTGVITDSIDKTTLAKLREDGTLSLSVGGQLHTASPSDPEAYSVAKAMVATKIATDIKASIATRPNLTTRITDSLNKDYAFSTATVEPDGSTRIIVRDKVNDSPLAILKYDKNSNFSQAEWTSPQNNGSLTWPEKSPATILHMLKENKLAQFQPLPTWAIS